MDNKKIFSSNLNILMEKNDKNRNDIAQALGVSYYTVTDWVKGKKYPRMDKVERLAHYFNCLKSDLIESTEGKYNNTNRIPVIGMIQAGLPIDAIEDPIDWEEVTPQMKSLGELFCLQVKGDSMQPRIVEGDVVVVLKQSDIESGELGIVRVNGDTATIKKVMKYEDGSIALVPSNPTYSVMRYSKEEIVSKPVEIIGKVIELRAKF